MDHRKPLSKRLRYEVLRRDNHACRYCGATAPEAKLTVDHVTPVALGGTDDPTNLVTACMSCNAGKSATPADAALIADVEQDAIRWAKARVAAVDLLRARKDDLCREANLFFEYWSDLFTATYGDYPEPPDDAHSTVMRFIEMGVSRFDMVEYADITLQKSRSIPERSVWPYFAGCCWNRVREIEALATELAARHGA